MGVQAWTGVIVVVAVLAAATVVGLLLRRRNGRFSLTPSMPRPTAGARPEPAREAATLAALGVTSGNAVTLVQFSTAFCAPCRATRVLCAGIADRLPGVRHVEIDAESNLDAVRSLDIWRTPTILVVDADLTVRRRASGAPTRAQLFAAMADLLPRSALAMLDEMRVA